MMQPEIDLAELAQQQGVAPVQRFEDLLGDFWPEDESIEEFLAWLRHERETPVSIPTQSIDRVQRGG